MSLAWELNLANDKFSKYIYYISSFTFYSTLYTLSNHSSNNRKLLEVNKGVGKLYINVINPINVTVSVSVKIIGS